MKSYINSEVPGHASQGQRTKTFMNRDKYKQVSKLCIKEPIVTHMNFSYRTMQDTQEYKIELKSERILESLALKKRGEMENERRAYEAHKLWEEDRKSMDRKQEQKQKEWKSYVEKKRKLENNVNTMRMEEVKENLRQAQTLLEARLEERDKRIRDVIHQTEHKKILDSFEKKENYDKKRFLVEANHLQRELERIMQYEECEHALTEKLKKAEKLRERGLRNFHKKVASANKLEELRHQERMEELLEEDKFLRSQKIKELQLCPVELLYRTCQEIATELGISVNHVRNIHHQQETERQPPDKDSIFEDREKRNLRK
ncbi:trichohyalin [Diaphorina citri]|uniref:Trichohyalin n=1 Tax=Diaphorina citri TaxID=121845 RepID=A0A3Q0J1C9_DIACI|nr:trichohyalin [Diaphorina citri]